MSNLILPGRLREGRQAIGPRNQRGFIINPYGFSGGGAGGSLYAMIMADITAYGGVYFRHGEASGSVMNNEAGTAGAYVSSPALGNAALYPGGPTSMLAAASKYGSYSTALPSFAAGFTLLTIVKLNAVTGTRGLVSRDTGGSGRCWQWRTSGTSIQFVNIPHSATIATSSGVVSAGVPIMLGVTSAVSGGSSSIAHYKNGSLAGSGASGNSNLGGAANDVQVGYTTGGGGLSADAYFSESAIIASPMTPTRMADYAAAAGF